MIEATDNVMIVVEDWMLYALDLLIILPTSDESPGFMKWPVIILYLLFYKWMLSCTNELVTKKVP